MGDSYLFRGLKPFERRLIYLSCLGILFCLYLLRFHNFSNLNNGQQEKEIGFLAETKSDIRIKNYAQTLWQAAQKNQKVREGDKVYTGAKSFATISLMNESRIELKENSLVEFKKLNNQNIADLDEGEYRVAVLKNLKIAIKGQIASIEGSSEIILKVDKNKNFSVETLKGTPTIQYQSKTYSPTKESQVNIAHLQPEKLTEVSAAAPIQVGLESKTYDYYLKLYDVYDRIGSQLKLKDKSTSLVRLKVPLTIETFESSSEILVEYSNEKDFSNSRRFSVDSFDRSLPQVYLGDNYWHCSQNDKDWSSKAHFHVRALVLPTSQVNARFTKQTLYLRDGLAEVDVNLSTNTNANGFLVESSRSPLFDSKATTYWSYQPQVHLKFTQAGKYYYRFRAVDEELRLGEWSETTTLEVNESANLSAPSFARQDPPTMSAGSCRNWKRPKPPNPEPHSARQHQHQQGCDQQQLAPGQEGQRDRSFGRDRAGKRRKALGHGTPVQESWTWAQDVGKNLRRTKRRSRQRPLSGNNRFPFRRRAAPGRLPVVSKGGTARRPGPSHGACGL